MSLDLAPSTASAPSGVDEQNPWLGLVPFTEDLRAFFHGRADEADELFRRVRRRTLTVLFGQSGLGKTSLLQAGLFPKLRAAGYLPVLIRLDHDPSRPGLSAQVTEAVAREIGLGGTVARPALTEAAGGTPTLWEYFHRPDRQPRASDVQAVRLALVFDQFEELFAIGQSRAEGRSRTSQFLKELADFVENRVPKLLADEFEQHPEEAEQFELDALDHRVLVSLREDYLPQLESLKPLMPSLAENRMRLTRMSGDKALEAVLIPGGMLITPDVARQVVSFVAGQAPRASDAAALDDVALAELEVEPSLLSLFCRELNERRWGKHLSRITSDLLAGSREQILEGFYQRCLADQPLGVREFIEDELLTDSGLRENMAIERARRALAQRQSPASALDVLVERRLLHLENRLDVQRVELMHDVLTPVVKKGRDERHQREATIRAESNALEAREKARRQRRRFRQIIAVMAAALVVVGGLGALAVQQWFRAEANARELQRLNGAAYLSATFARESEGHANANARVAKKQSELALDALHTVILEVRRRLANESGGEDAQHMVLDTVKQQLERTDALRYFQEGLKLSRSLAESNPADTQAQRGLWTSYNQIGDIAQQIGETYDALRYYQHGLEIGQKLAESNSGDAQTQRDLSVSYDRVGDTAQQLGQAADAPKYDRDGKLAEALKYFQDGLEIRRKLAESSADDVQAQLDLSMSYDRIGDVAKQLGQTEPALKYYLDGLEIRRKLAESDAGDAQAQRDLSTSYEKLGEVTLKLGRTSDALKYYQDSLEIRRKFADLNPRDAQAQRDLSIYFAKLGDVLLELGQTAEALKYYQDSLEIRRKLAESNPGDAQAQRNLSISYEKLGDVTLQLGQTAEALKYYQDSLEIRRKLAESKPGDAQVQRELSLSDARLGKLTLELGKIAEAQKLTESDPSDTQAQHNLLVSYLAVGDVTTESGQTAAALKYYQGAMEICRKLAESYPDNAQAQRNLSISYLKLGEVTLKLGQASAALKYYQLDLEIAQKLAEPDPGDAQARRDLSISYNNLGKVTLQLGQTAEALKYYQDGMELRRKLVDSNPGDALAQRDLWVSYSKLGDVTLQLGQTADALKYYQDGLEIAKKLAESNADDAQAQGDLWVSHYLLARAEKQNFDYAAAQAHYQEAIMVLQRRLEQGLLKEQSEGALQDVEREADYCADAALAFAGLKEIDEVDVRRRKRLLCLRCFELARKGDVPSVAEAADELREFAWSERGLPVWADEFVEKQRLLGVGEREAIKPYAAHRLYGAACGYSLCVRVFDTPPHGGVFLPPEEPRVLSHEEQEARQKYVKLALDMLQQAIDAGYKDADELRQDADLTPLRPLPEFQKLLDSITPKIDDEQK